MGLRKEVEGREEHNHIDGRALYVGASLRVGRSSVLHLKKALEGNSRRPSGDGVVRIHRCQALCYTAPRGSNRVVGTVSSLLAIAMLIAFLHPVVASTDTYTQTPHSIEVDVCAEVHRIVDGDTFDAFPVGRVRLADVDAPELETEEGRLAKHALSSLISLYGPKVYLDVDDLHLVDRYNRLIAVVYLRFNETHVLNVNRWLIDNGYAIASDYGNEFNPYTWILYSYVPRDPCPGKTLAKSPIITLTITKSSTITETALITKTEITTLALEVTQMTTSAKTVTITQTVLETPPASPLPIGLAIVAVVIGVGLALWYLVARRKSF